MTAANHITPAPELEYSRDDPLWHQAWLDWRDGGMGSSDVAAAWSGSYGGAYKAVAGRIGITIPQSEQIKPEAAESGHRWEQPLADIVHLAKGYHIGGEQMLLEHPGNPRYLSTIDGLLLDSARDVPLSTIDAGVEIKKRHPGARQQWSYWRAQCQWHMFVSGCRRWLLVVGVINVEVDPQTGAVVEESLSDVRMVWIYADPDFQEDLRQLADWMLDHVDQGELPEPQDHYALPYVKAANARVNPDALADVAGMSEVVAEFEEAKADVAAATERKKAAEASIRARMGEAREAVTDDGVWRVRCGLPVRKFTDQSETDFVETFGADCGPACDTPCELHMPELVALVTHTRVCVDRDEAKRLMPEEYDMMRVSTPDRRLTIKQLKEPSE